MSNDSFNVNWRVHTPNLLREVLSNPSASILSQPINIFGNLLHEVGARAAKLNDPILNELMCRLTLYSVADPESPDFSEDVLKQVIEEANTTKRQEGE